MTGAGTKLDSLRLSPRELRRLGLVLALSLLAHALGWGGYEVGKGLGWWQRLHWPVWLHRLVSAKTLPSQPKSDEQQLTFVDVSQPTAEAPKTAKYYSSRNSLAADATHGDKDLAQINGKQTEIAKTENVPKPDFNKLQPARPAQPAKPEPQVTAKTTPPGDLALGKPDDSESKNQQRPQPQRPRTIREALAQQTHQLAGPAMQQEGGARRHALVPAFDVQATPFGEYDAAVFEAIQQYWNNELDSQQFAMDRTGRVTVQFRLNYDGTVTDVQILSSTVGVLLGSVCQNAIEGPSPFAPWPSDMRRMVGENYRQITVTFIYY